jgi:transcriptional regulator with XRE-family HTH domain
MKKEEKRKQFWDSIEDDKGSWLEKARYRRENRSWLRKSQRIAVRVLSVLNEKGMQQKELAEAMDVSPQQVSKIVKGKQNRTLETISKLESVLGVKLFEVPVPQFEMNVERKTVRTNLSKDKSAQVKSRKDLAVVNMQLWTPSSEDEIAA